MLHTPDGQPAGNIDRLMLLYLWAEHLKTRRRPLSIQKQPSPINNQVIIAAIGKPTAPLHDAVSRSLSEYWSQHRQVAIGYGDPKGDLDAREIMARAMTNWYQTQVSSEHILFTVGGAGALHTIFSALDEQYQHLPSYRVITPFPHYTLYRNNRHRLHPIDVMQEKGYQLTAERVEQSIQQAYQLAENDYCLPVALLLCDPYNPLGTTIDDATLNKLADLMKKYHKLTIILDEAYAEMVINGKQHTSLLRIAPDLMERIIVLRSATKALSAAGERMAIIICANQSLMARLVEKNIQNCGHAPRSLQHAYADTMSRFEERDRLDIANHYKPKIDYVRDRLKKMGAAMPDDHYQVSGTFYVMGDFSWLLGLALPPSTAKALRQSNDTMKTDEDIAYALLFEDAVTITPLSYFGVDPKKGYLRITCSSDDDELTLLMDRLESRLMTAFEMKRIQAQNDIDALLNSMKPHDATQHQQLHTAFMAICQQNASTCLELRTQVTELLALWGKLKQFSAPDQEKSATKIQSHYRGYLARKHMCEEKKAIHQAWLQYINQHNKNSSLYAKLIRFSLAERQAWLLAVNKNTITTTPSTYSASFLLKLATEHTMKLAAAMILITVIPTIALASFGFIGMTCLCAGIGIASAAATLLIKYLLPQPVRYVTLADQHDGAQSANLLTHAINASR